MKSQSNSQELETVGEILDWYFWSVDKSKDENWTNIREAKAKLLELVLSCNLEKVRHSPLCHVNLRGFESEQCDCGAFQVNAAIDTIEQNIRAKFQ